MRFVDRADEINVFEDEFAQVNKRASLAVVYGRRRIGKTELIKKFASNKPHVYFLATLQSKEDVIANFSRKAAEFFNDTATLGNPHTTWAGFFGYLEREPNLSHL
ncbi:ATP-binding protein [Candidatus Micrarchaeota archaeon]|nr:ATP-binding protein [Candidatus Micrarchaeota archaeon]